MVAHVIPRNPITVAIRSEKVRGTGFSRKGTKGESVG
jgi:hypothetical protein